MNNGRCVNCGLGTPEEGSILCKSCIDTFPGERQELQSMEDAFQTLSHVFGFDKEDEDE